MKKYQFVALLVMGAALSTLLLSACGLRELTGAPAATSEEAVTAAIHDYLDKQGFPIDQFEMQVRKVDSNYAWVEVLSVDPESPGGFNAFLRQEDNVWTTIASGSGMEQEQVESLGIPQSVWPEAWLNSDSVAPAAAPLDSESSAGCPQPTPGTLLLTDEVRAYCLLYPASHTVEQLETGNTEVVVGEVMNHIDPRVSIYTEDLAGRSLEQAVAEFLAGYTGFELERTDLTIAGEAAIQLDNIPGQDFYRKVFLAHDGLLYHLAFEPYDQSLADNFPQAQALYQIVIDSFQFTTP